MKDHATPPDFLERLNEAQRAAVLHGDGPLAIIAGAGSGKTGTLAHRVARLVLDGADPRRILLLTFSRRAAGEMVRRIERIAAEIMGDKGASLIAGLEWAGTFHAIGARMLRQQAPLIGLDPAFTLHDRADSEDLMGLVRHGLGLSQTEARFPGKGTCLAIYSRSVNAREPLDEVLKRFPWCAGWTAELGSLFAGYVEAKQSGQVLDYDDLLLYWAEMLAEPAVAAEVGARFDHVLVDEYQDTNCLQAEILAALKPDGTGVTVVGDDAQAIYGFRAADVRNILDFPARFAPPARVVTLERNYRSTQPILAAANGVIGEAGERFAKELWSEREAGGLPRLVTVLDEAAQAAYVCGEVLAAREEGIDLKAQAVLFRTAHHSGPLEVELVRRNIPFVKFGGLKFLEAAHVKDVLAVLRFAENPRDRIAGFRALQLLPGVGPAAADAMLQAMAGGSEVRPPKRAAGDWPDLLDLLVLLGGGGAGWPGEMEAVCAWYGPHLARIHEDAAVRQGDLGQLAQVARGFASRQAFLTELTLDPPQATSDLSGQALRDEDYLVLSTIHSAKGQEWKSVFVLNCTDGCIPSDLATDSPAEVEEERRLMYVAMTRARDALHLMTPLRFYVHGQAARGDRHVYAARSRFLPEHLLDRFERVAWAPPAAAGTGARPVAPRDLKARMRAMWG